MFECGHRVFLIRYHEDRLENPSSCGWGFIVLKPAIDLSHALVVRLI